jgi:transcriptional regulator with XRE-family HTH domain
MKGEELRKWRLKLGYTQAQLAEVLGISMRQLIRYELNEEGGKEIPDMLRLALRSVPSKRSMQRNKGEKS